MKKLIAGLLTGLVLVGYTSCSQSGYEVKVTYANPQEGNNMLYMIDGRDVIDSAQIVNNKAAFSGQTDSVLVYQLAEKKKGNFIRVAQLFIQKDAKINVNVDKDIVVEDNGGANSKYNAYIRDFKAGTDKAMAEYRKMVNDKVDQDKIMAFVDDFNKKNTEKWQSAVDANSDNLAGTAILADNCRGIRDYATFKTLIAKAKFAQYFPILKTQEEFFKNLDNTSEGKMFVDFSGKDLEGKACKLSDFVGKGKFVLVDFWASWCGPCRGEIPNLIAVNKKFGGDKFMVLGVNVWDEEKAFKKAMDSEKINYAQIFASENKDATNLYGINGIPQIMLFGPDGKIIKRDLRGEAIAKTVEEQLKK